MAFETVFDSQDIEECLPHRYPMLLVDRVVEFVDGKRCVGLKNVTRNEEFFCGHFPSRPIMPGVLIIEAMAQTAGILAKKSTDGVPKEAYIYLVGATDVKWKRPVVPGDTLLLEVDLIKRRKPLLVIEAKATVDGQLAASATISAFED